MAPILEGGLSLIIPAYNEEENIEEVVQDADRVFKTHFEPYQIVIVNDGSTDGTGEVAESLTAKFPALKVVHHSVNRGLGEALKTGYQHASLEYVSFVPADGQIASSEIVKLARHIKDAHMVISNYYEREDSRFRLMLSGAWRILMKMILDFDLGSQGPYLFRRQLLKEVSLKSSTGLLNLEFPMKVSVLGRKMNTIRISCKPRLQGTSKVTNLATMFKTLYEMVKLRWQ
jgi:glycosyltransferase involved in cell wall biosynthesis